MAEIPNFLEGTAYGVLNDILSSYHDNNGYALPNRFDVLNLTPSSVSTLVLPSDSMSGLAPSK